MLLNLPLKNQLNDPNSDGNPDNNARANCVAEVLSSVAQCYTGRIVHGGDLKDAAYGAAYTGATDPMRYAGVLARDYGIDIEQVDGVASVLMNTIITRLKQRQAVIGAIPSMWGNTTAADIAANGGGTHEVAFCDYDGTNLTAMNPWPVDGNNAFYHTMPLAWWASRLVYGHVHVLKETVAVAVDTAGLGKGFSDYAVAHNLQGPHTPENYEQGWSWAAWDAGTVLYYSVADGVRDDRAGWVLSRVASKPVAQVPAELHSMLSNLSNLLAPFAAVASDNAAMMKKLGY